MKYKQHLLSSLFPAMENREFRDLVEGIKAIGQRVPIVTIGDEVLDGWHRYQACVELGIEPVTKEYDEEITPLQFVMAQNMQRRQMNASQRALCIVQIAKHTGLTIAEQAAVISVSPRTIVTARSLTDSGDIETIKDVLTGKRRLPNKPKAPTEPDAQDHGPIPSTPKAAAERAVTTKAAGSDVIVVTAPEDDHGDEGDFVAISREEYAQFEAYKEYLGESDIDGALERQRLLIKNLERERDELLSNQNLLIETNARQKRIIAKLEAAKDDGVGF